MKVREIAGARDLGYSKLQLSAFQAGNERREEQRRSTKYPTPH
jgi:hypothetical protein